MASFRTEFWAWSLCAGILGGCGGTSSVPFQGPGGDAGGAGGSAGTPISDVPAQFAPAICDTASQCYGPILDFLLGGNSCTGLLTKQLQQSDFSLVEAAVAKGTVEYDGTKLPACLDAIRQKGCAILSTRLSGVCSDVLRGTIAAGQACTFDAECTPGLFCKTTTCPGVCTSFLAEATPCESDGNCQDGLSCGTPQGGGTKVCKKAVAVDLSGKTGDTCDPTTAKLCQSGLACAGVSNAAGRASFQCETPLTAPACHVAFPEECPSGQFCKLPPNSFDGTCAPVPKVGEPCGKYSPSDNRPVCAPASVCDTASGNCVAFQDLAGACTADNQCYSKSCDTAGKCVASKCAN